MKRFICKDCGYRMKSESKPKKCSYCGKENTKEEQGAEELIEEVEEILG